MRVFITLDLADEERRALAAGLEKPGLANASDVRKLVKLMLNNAIAAAEERIIIDDVQARGINPLKRKAKIP